ncbi:CYTH domain-containing protein [Candidatus Parcubacteria bacterium]|nr:CYTH domain-containing protein [Candidatus Parcubacteria bacterium]
MSQYEIEVKSLLGSKENADKLRTAVLARGAKLIGENKQLNHYFVLTDAPRFKQALAPHIPVDKRESFDKILENPKDVSVRTRNADGKVLLVVKASVGDDTSANGVSRMEFESAMDMSLAELDQLLLQAGLEYQAKWSREREEYELGDAHVCLDKNAGYGYLAEFEKMGKDAAQADTLKKEIHALMGEFGVVELPQDRLERMFKHYNQNWRDYYGTEKVFTIK